MSEPIKKCSFLIGVFLLGGVLAWWVFSPIRLEKQACSDSYPFVSSEIDCQKIDEKINQVEGLHKNIEQIIADEKKQQHILRASVFYRCITK